ncbi:DNA polymerase III subunit alpha [Paenibacillus thalictri]|uniref:DNA polymerase III subunit alpha n=1 Tax=Paenibacillus thalictri TaxID=2527873 RepID=A0A4Q9DMM3_9BACL|nr:DNA polymerase III subunit alpha [Paenibacillus thalictri]TBL75057.1 DNA polymerase III subunit alpha [Paenibacillus thalictri]
MNEFIHLHVHSEYSLLDGAARIEDLVGQAARLGMSALALTDHGVMYGAVSFYKACLQHGIKPIIGCEVYYTAGSIRDKGTRQEQPIYHLILLAKNMQGYQNLMKLVSIGHLQGFHYKPRLDHEHLAQYAEGLVCLSSCLGSEISQHLVHDRYDEAKKAALRYRSIFGDDFFLEIQDHGMIEQKKVMQSMIQLSADTGIPLIATNDVHYIRQEDHAVQDILICIGTGKTVEDKDRLQFSSSQLYLKSGEEMEKLFAHVPEAIANTRIVADRCQLELEFGRSILPKFKPIPEHLTAGQYLGEICREGLIKRYGASAEWEDEEFRSRVTARLQYELGVIESMGFSDYFLIVWDFIRFAHEQGIATGPGRGSSAGSLVAYVLRITDVDPIRYNLLFERFLNPERVTMPDIDIDFSDLRRDEVIDYVVGKYGKEHVAQIITFGTMAAKAAVRDVGRVLALPYNEVDKAAKLIPHQLGVTLREALEISPELKILYEKQPKTAELLDIAMKVEGMPRHASTHAAGVIISREPLTQYVPLQEGGEQTALTQYTMEHLESIGLLKMDFLGLRTLSIIERTLQWIREQHGKAIDFHQIPMDGDIPTYQLLERGDTTGIFQLESSGVRRVLKDLRPNEFTDIISVLALYRPGPMEFIPKYIAGKHGRIEVEYPHPSLEPLLSDTYGIIVYQEQIMQIASKMAGFSLGEADLLRRAVSKKKREVLDEQRAHFVKGSISEGYSEEEANRVYDMIVRFADYGFPKAHATAYGVLAFQTAYLKAHYPVQFMASMLTAVMGSHHKVAEYVDECRRMGIAVLPPDVNESGVVFTPAKQAAGGSDSATANNNSGEPVGGSDGAVEGSTDRLATAAVHSAAGSLSPAQPASDSDRREEGRSSAIRFGLAAVKNVGTHAIEAIMKAREEDPFESLLDFCRRIDLRVCNKRVIESLIQAGAMDSLPGHRAQLLAMLDETIEAAVKWRKERDDLQLTLLGFTEEANWEVEYPNIAPMTTLQRLELERELVGLYISGSPLDAYMETIDRLEAEPIHYLAEKPDHSDVTVAGMVVSLKTIVTKKGQPMAFIELEDRIAKVEVVLFPETWKRCGSLVQKGSLLLVRAKVQTGDEDVKLLADTALSLDDPELLDKAKRLQAPARPQPGAAQARGSQADAASRAQSGAARPQPGVAQARGPQADAASRAQSGAARVQPGVAQARGSQADAASRAQQPPARDPQAGAATPGGTERPAAGAPTPPRYRTGQPAADSAGVSARAAAAARSAQRVFVKIPADREQPSVLTALKEQLLKAKGPLHVILFYESSQKMLGLSEMYAVKPSPELFHEIEALLGKETVKVK